MKFSETRQEIFKALALFRKNLKQPKKDADNPFFKSKYVPLENVTEAIDLAIEGTGMSYTQEVTSASNNQVSVATLVTHESGEYILYDPLTVNTSKIDVQAFGSAETYARRYTLGAVFGVTSELDDDGNEAVKNAPKMISDLEIQKLNKQIETFSLEHETSEEKTYKAAQKKTNIYKNVEQLTNEEYGIISNCLIQISKNLKKEAKEK